MCVSLLSCWGEGGEEQGLVLAVNSVVQQLTLACTIGDLQKRWSLCPVIELTQPDKSPQPIPHSPFMFAKGEESRAESRSAVYSSKGSEE